MFPHGGLCTFKRTSTNIPLFSHSSFISISRTHRGTVSGPVSFRAPRRSMDIASLRLLLRFLSFIVFIPRHNFADEQLFTERARCIIQCRFCVVFFWSFIRLLRISISSRFFGPSTNRPRVHFDRDRSDTGGDEKVVSDKLSTTSRHFVECRFQM